MTTKKLLTKNKKLKWYKAETAVMLPCLPKAPMRSWLTPERLRSQVDAWGVRRHQTPWGEGFVPGVARCMGMGSGSFELTGVFAQITGASLLSTHYCEATQGREGSSCHTAMLLSPSRIKLLFPLLIWARAGVYDWKQVRWSLGPAYGWNGDQTQQPHRALASQGLWAVLSPASLLGYPWNSRSDAKRGKGPAVGWLTVCSELQFSWPIEQVR